MSDHIRTLQLAEPVGRMDAGSEVRVLDDAYEMLIQRLGEVERENAELRQRLRDLGMAVLSSRREWQAPGEDRAPYRSGDIQRNAARRASRKYRK